MQSNYSELPNVISMTNAKTFTTQRQSISERLLVYRGATYHILQQRVNNADQEQARLAQLVGKRLMYRGATYEIFPASLLEVIVPKTMRQLIYRGTTYLKAI